MADQQSIDDALLGKFLAGETDPAETARVRQWLASRPGASEPGHDDFEKFERIWEAAGEPSATSSGASTVDTNAAWRKVQQKIKTVDRKPVTKSEPVIKPLPVQRNDRRVGEYQPLWRLAAFLVLVAGMGWLTFRLQFMSKDHPDRNMVTLTTNEQKISKILPDGTRILLNRHSTLRYPATFADERREVALTGEAFFDVTPDATRPFRIQARKNVVQVLGTSFSVRAYDANVSVAVQTGKVRFSGGKKAVLLTKNQQATFEASVDTICRAMLLSQNAFAYKTGQLVFDKEPLRDVVQAINQVYNADVRLANTQLGNCRLTTRFNKTSLETVLAVTAETLGLHVRHEGKQVILEGAGCQ
ncbi:FecR domain-containing protein [Spirosoma endophyticum]|uniref:FecR family protein n=1 Tax=Spirosoma endophyticum TaxID=662367 RepID=A0A1I1MKA7_9BACT|nr:FecR domain-containing protein [Spirosoma endophyticum]SFC83618.1 FecR family protein [Spirosoma endophyticum]